MSPQAVAWSQCLDIGSNDPGTIVGLRYCNGSSGYLSQQWWRKFDANSTNFLVVSASSGYRQC